MHPSVPKTIVHSCVGIVVCAAALGAAWTSLALGDEPANEQPASVSAAKVGSAEQESLRATERSWPLFRGDIEATGVAVSPLPDQLQLLWKYELPEGSFQSAAAIVDGVVYLADAAGKVVALNLADGRERWKVEASIGFSAAPTVYKQRIYLGDVEGKFHCLKAEDGQTVWNMSVNSEIDSSATVYQGQVLFGTRTPCSTV